MRNEDLTSRREAAIPNGWGSVFPVYVAEADGSTITDVDGRTYVDFAAGIAVVNTGHRNTRVIDAVSDQLDRFTHTCFMVTPALTIEDETLNLGLDRFATALASIDT